MNYSVSNLLMIAAASSPKMSRRIEKQIHAQLWEQAQESSAGSFKWEDANVRLVFPNRKLRQVAERTAFQVECHYVPRRALFRFIDLSLKLWLPFMMENALIWGTGND